VLDKSGDKHVKLTGVPMRRAVDVAGGAPVLVNKIGPVGDQAAAGDEESSEIDRGQLYAEPQA
jgi:hypothetical protein